MRRVAKKVLIVLCMLVVTTAQLYSSAFAMPMPMDTGSSSTSKTNASQAYASQTHTSQAHASQPHASHVMHTNENVQTVEESCCELIATEKNNHCTTMTNGATMQNGITPENSSVNHCDEMANCAQAHCVNPATASLSIYFFYMKAFSTSHIAINYLLIDQHGSSLYRPPIYR